MHVELIESVARLQALVPDWNDLLARSKRATPFQTPEWLLPWWQVFGSGQLFCFAVYSKGQLAGFAPMFLHPWLGRRQVTFLGTGVSDCLDFILDPMFEAEAANAIFRQLQRESNRWDLCDLQDLPPESPLIGNSVPQYTCMRIPLEASVEAFRDRLPHGLRRNLRRYRDHLESFGTVEFETVTDDDFPAALRELIRLHRARWASKDDPGMIDGPAMQRFHSQAALNLHARGVARLHLMRLNGAIRAVVYALFHRNIAYSYLGGFDPELSRFSPGALVLSFAIEQSIREGAECYDLLRGNEAYKWAWGAEPYTTYRLQIRKAAAA